MQLIRPHEHFSSSSHQQLKQITEAVAQKSKSGGKKSDKPDGSEGPREAEEASWQQMQSFSVFKSLQLLLEYPDQLSPSARRYGPFPQIKQVLALQPRRSPSVLPWKAPPRFADLSNDDFVYVAYRDISQTTNACQAGPESQPSQEICIRSLRVVRPQA